MTCPILQLKVSRLNHSKSDPDRGDYMQLKDNDGNLHVAQLVKRISGMLSVRILGTDIRVHINPYTLKSGSHHLGGDYEVVSAEKMPQRLANSLNLPQTLAPETIIAGISQWFEDSRPYVSTLSGRL